MKTRSTLTRLGLLVGIPAILLSVAAARAQQQVDWDAVEIATHHVRGTVHYVSGRGGNIGLSVGDDGVLMVDDQFAPLTDRILEAIGGISDGDIRFVINTHVHGDHVGGQREPRPHGHLIMAQDRVRLRLAETMPAVALPAVTYSEDVTVHLNGEEVHIFPVPASHTDGDSVIHFRDSDVMVVGDVFRTVAFPVIDRNNGGSLPGTIDTLGIIAGAGGARHADRAGARRGVHAGGRRRVPRHGDRRGRPGGGARRTGDDLRAGGGGRHDGSLRSEVGRPRALPDRGVRRARRRGVKPDMA